MLKKTISYIDLEGVEKTEDFYFNITATELTKLDAKYDGGLEMMLKRIVDAKDIEKIMDMFELILHIAYGEKSTDGKHFWKRDKEGHDLADAFEQTPAYDLLFTELLSDPEYAGKFIEQIIPKKADSSVKVVST